MLKPEKAGIIKTMRRMRDFFAEHWLVCYLAYMTIACYFFAGHVK